MAANYFDQFDPSTAKPVDGGNFFDQFDPSTAKPEPKRTLAGTAGDLGVVALKGAVGLPQAAVGLLDIPTGGHVGRALEGAGVRFKDAQDTLDTMYSPAQQAANRKVREAEGFVGTARAMLENPSTIATGVGESLPQMLGGAGVARGLLAAVPKIGAIAAGALGEGVMGAGSAAEQIREQTPDGLLTGKQAALAGASGTATAALGGLGGKVAQRLGVGDVDTMLASGAARAAGPGSTRSMPRQIAEGAVAEGVLEEMPQSMAEQALQNVALDKPVGEGVGAAAAQGLITGAAMGGVGGGIGASGNRAQQRAQEQATQAAEDPAQAPAGAAPLDAAPPAMEPATAQPDTPPGAPAQSEPGAPDAPLPTNDPVTPEQRIAQLEERLSFIQQQAKGNGWDQRLIAARDEATQELEALRGPAPEPAPEPVPDAAPQVPLSAQMGIDPTAGPLSRSAAIAVDSGASQQLQEAQFLGATGRNLQARRTGPGITDDSNVIDVQGRVIEDRAIGTPRRLTATEGARESGAIAFREGVPRAEIAAIPNLAQRAQQLRGYDEAARQASAPPALPAPSNLREGLARIRAQRQEAANAQAATQQATAPAQAVPAARAGAVETAGAAPVSTTTGVNLEPQADQAQQAISQQPQAGAAPAAEPGTSAAGTPAPAGAPTVRALTNAATPQNDGAQGTPAPGAQGTAPAPQAAVARPDGWRKSMLKAVPVAKGLGIEHKGKRLAQVVAEIDAADAQRASGLPVAQTNTAGAPDAAPPRNLRLADERAPGAAAPAPDGAGRQGAGPAPAVGAGRRQGSGATKPGAAVRAAVPDAGGAGQPAAGVAGESGAPTKKKPARGILAKKAEAEAKARADYFTPGNIVKSYSGHDRVIAYSPPDADGAWSVKVRAVQKQGDAWVDTQERERQHATQPDARELKAGPVARSSNAAEAPQQVQPSRSAPRSETGKNQAAALDGKAQEATKSVANSDASDKVDGGAEVIFSRSPATARAQPKMSPELAQDLANIRPPERATKESVHAAVRQVVNGLGLLPNRLGRVVVATSAEIKQDWEPLIGGVSMEAGGDAGKAQGFYDPNTKTIFLIADNIRSGDELGVVAHELMHKHGQAVLGKAGWDQLHGAIEGWASAPTGSMERKVYDEAAARVRKSRPQAAPEQEYSSQELFPYAVQVALEEGVRPSMLAKPGTVARWLAQVRAMLRQVWNKLSTKPDSFNSQDLVNLAFGIAQRENPEHGGALDGATSEAGNALAALSRVDELFQTPKSQGKTVAEIAADVDPAIKVRRVPGLPGRQDFELTMANGKTVSLMVAPTGLSRYQFDYVDGQPTNELIERPGENPEDVPPGTGDVWIDVSALESGEGGREVYAIAANFAHNNGMIFIGDPAGLSDEAMRRRPEQMLSSALKYGTTAHLAPHPRQVSGDKSLGIPPLKWVYGDDLGNIRRLIDLNLKALDNAGHGDDSIRFDPTDATFRDSGDGEISRAGIDAIAQAGIARGSRAGGSTLARRAVLASLVRGEGQAQRGADGRPDGLLEDLLRLADQSLPSVRGLFYSRSVAQDGAAQRAGDAIKAVSATNLKQRAGWKATDYLGLGLQALGRRQLVDIYGDALPLEQYNKLAAQMEADKNEVGANADKLATAWGKLKDERQLAELMHDATLAQMDPAKEHVPGDDEMRYKMLRARFNALTPDAKQVYLDARSAYQAHHANVRQAIKDRIERSELKGERKAALLKQMDDEFFKAVKGVYFPLARFGQYVVVVKGADGKVASVNRAETMAEAQALRSSLLKAFPAGSGYTVARPILGKEFIAGRDAVGRGFMTELYAVLDKQDMDAAARAELEDTLGQLYLSSLPDLSWAKHGIHRKGTPGFSQDARRAYAQNMFHGARYLAKLRYSDLMQDELNAMQQHVDDWKEVEDFDQPKAQRVVDEMNKRHESLMNPKSNPLSTALTSFGFIFHLGLSPASAMVNLSQTALVAYPIMGAKWGFGKASAALLKASSEAARGKNDITGSLTVQERQAYDEAVRTGVIDVTMAHDLAGISQGEDAGVMWKLRPVMKWASFMFHHAERFNRQVTFVAAYRLAREAGANHQSAYEQAADATYKGHFDYSAGNRPRIMQGNTARVLLLFKQYSQNMVYTLARSAHQSLKGATPEVRAEARKTLGGLLTMHAAAAGVLGLPMVTTLLAAASMLGGDDDEPWDAQVALQNMLADTFGQKSAEVLAHGLSRLTPWDVSGRVGLDRLIFPDVQEGLEGQRLGESAMAAALGPVAGIGINALKGLQLMSEGHYLRGLEALAPSVVRGPLKALRYESEGVKDKSGIVVQDEVDAAALWGQAAGFSPSDVRRSYEGKSAIVQHDRALQARRSALVEQFAMAAMAGDEAGKTEAREAIAKFNEKNPARRILPLNLMQSVAQRQKRIREAKEGVYLPSKRRDAMEQGRFALAQGAPV